jgi:hypothetical protein
VKNYQKLIHKSKNHLIFSQILKIKFYIKNQPIFLVLTKTGGWQFLGLIGYLNLYLCHIILSISTNFISFNRFYYSMTKMSLSLFHPPMEVRDIEEATPHSVSTPRVAQVPPHSCHIHVPLLRATCVVPWLHVSKGISRGLGDILGSPLAEGDRGNLILSNH